MHEIFIERLKRTYGTELTEYHVNLIYEILTVKRLRRYEHLLKKGEICAYFGFVVNGALKEYTVDTADKESITNLYLEEDWCVDRQSLLEKIPSPYFVEASEDTDLLLMSEEGYERILVDPLFSRMALKLVENINYHLRQQLHIAKTYSAREKLAHLEKNNPEYLQRFPLHVIASYLGITKETLSRLRSRRR